MRLKLALTMPDDRVAFEPMGGAVTSHARARMRQRGIGAAALDCILDYGREAFDHRGCVVLYFDKAARQRLAKELPGRKDLERVARCYAVISAQGTVVTVGHRFRRIVRRK